MLFRAQRAAKKVMVLHIFIPIAQTLQPQAAVILHSDYPTFKKQSHFSPISNDKLHRRHTTDAAAAL